jgi:hypothetical protein
MALTRVTSQVLDANAVSSIKLANGAVTARNFANLSVELRHMAPDANVASVHADLSTNVNLLQTNVNTTTANINIVQTNVNAAESNAASATANSIQNAANVVTLLANVVQLSANIDVIQDNVNIVHANANGITDDADVIFNVNKTFSQNVTIQGNLIVVGSQVDLGVGTATIDDNFIVVSANLTGTPATDSGIIVTRGSEGNVFIGDHIAEDGIVFALSQSPHDNATISIQEYLDVHANAFHTSSGMNFSRVHFGHKDDESTGIIVDTTSNNETKFISSGSEVASIGPNGLTTIISTDAGSTAGPELILYRNSASPAPGDYIGQIQFKGRQDGPGDEIYAKVTGKISDETNGTEDGLIETAIKGDGSFTIVSRQKADDLQLLNGVGLDSAGRIQSASTVSALGVDLLSNDYVTYTRLNANVNVLQDNVNIVQDNVAIITGGGTLRVPFTNVNTAVGTSNVFFVGQDTADDANIVVVTLDGITQGNTEFVMNHSNNTIQFKDESIPSGTVVTIFSLV